MNRTDKAQTQHLQETRRQTNTKDATKSRSNKTHTRHDGTEICNKMAARSV